MSKSMGGSWWGNMVFFSEYAGSHLCLGVKMNEWDFVSFIFYFMHISFVVTDILVCMIKVQITRAIESLELGNFGYQKCVPAQVVSWFIVCWYSRLAPTEKCITKRNWFQQIALGAEQYNGWRPMWQWGGSWPSFWLNMAEDTARYKGGEHMWDILFYNKAIP